MPPVRPVTTAPPRPQPPGGAWSRWAAASSLGGALLLLAALGVELAADGATAMRVTVSAAAADGRHASLLTASKLVYALCLISLAPVLHRSLPGTSVAGPLALMVGGGAGVVLVAFRCGHACLADGLAVGEVTHIGAVAVGAAATVLAPLLVARRVRVDAAERAYARFSAVASAAVLAGLIGWGLADGTPVDGAIERGAIAIAAAWLAVTAGRLLWPRGAQAG